METVFSFQEGLRLQISFMAYLLSHQCKTDLVTKIESYTSPNDF